MSNDIIDFVERQETPVTLEVLAHEVRKLREQQEEILAVVRSYGEQLAPALDGLKNSALGKMFGM